MPIICRFKDTQEMVGSCPTRVKTGTLINSAVADGLGTADEFEEIFMTLAEYQQYIAEYIATHPRPPDPRLPLIRSFAQKMIALGFTLNELKAVYSYIKKWD